MSNLGYFQINTNGEYKSLAGLTGITFESGTKYVIQVRLGAAIFIEAASTPTEGGFYFDTTFPIQYEAGDETLYIRTNKNTDGCVINIGD